jgi:hypothetical protein
MRFSWLAWCAGFDVTVAGKPDRVAGIRDFD